MSAGNFRSSEEGLVDKLLLLYLIKQTNSFGTVKGITKLEKLVFLTENLMIKDKTKGFNYEFHKWNYGPYSLELHREDYNSLVEQDIINEGSIKLTTVGKTLLKECEPLLEENKQYRLNSLSFPTNNVSAIVILTFSSRNTSTNAASSGESVARVNRDNSGVITIKHLYSSYTRKLSGILEFDGWEINGDNIHPIFTVRNNATSTTSCTASIGIKGIESSRLNTEVVGPSVTAAPSQAGDVFDVDNFSVSAGATITKHISATAALNFDLSGSASQDLTITATGAAVGDTVALGVPNGSVTADTLFWAWVSATNTVTVRAMRIAGTPNPASGTFRVDVWQH
ncbi:hypothetical protein LCGC14_2389980 [marine sediment metagenome]|uniref:Antitoxin SocA-like Panacea domain-containing protein n=1 Tax=marine sediment metagenome TaxID=412755 RepID=A0A0F9BYK1_9ZZZZ